MKVAVISQLPPPTHGSTLMTRVLLETFDSLGVTWRLVDRRFSRSIGEVGAFSARKVVSALGMLCRLVSCLTWFRPDVVVVYATNRTFSFLVDWMLAEVLRLSRVRVVLYLHTVGFNALVERGRSWSWLVRRVLTSANDVVCLGPSLYRDVARWVPPDRVTYIPNTPPEPPPVPADINPRGPVLFLSNVLLEKGPDTFIEVAAQLAKVDPDRCFILAGSRTSEETESRLAELVAELNLGEALQRTEVRGAEHKWQLLQECSVLVFPSRYQFEAQPLVIVEAMSASRPIVAFDIGGLADVVVTGETGHIINNGDLSAMAARLMSLLADPAALVTTSQLSRKRYEAMHSLDAYRVAWARLLTSFTPHEGGGAPAPGVWSQSA